MTVETMGARQTFLCRGCANGQPLSLGKLLNASKTLFYFIYIVETRKDPSGQDI
ncbi:MAG: hypothetical protein ACFCUU_12930 [Cyclobacteriaceae bacterium]